MGYIRTDEDYYISQGHSQESARVKVEMDRRGVDPGFCNPRKAKEYDEALQEVKRSMRKKGRA